jgi:hypothetical protein
MGLIQSTSTLNDNDLEKGCMGPLDQNFIVYLYSRNNPMLYNLVFVGLRLDRDLRNTSRPGNISWLSISHAWGWIDVPRRWPGPQARFQSKQPCS